MTKPHTPCFDPKYDPIDESGAEIPNHSRTIKSIVPKGTAPDEPAAIRKKFSRNTMAKTMVGRTVAAMKVFFLLSVPPKDA